MTKEEYKAAFECACFDIAIECFVGPGLAEDYYMNEGRKCLEREKKDAEQKTMAPVAR